MGARHRGLWTTTSPASGSRSAITTAGILGVSSATREIESHHHPGGRQRSARLIRETPSAATLVLDVEDWPGHRAGQHVDIRLTAEDGYHAQRSYSLASAPEDGVPAITVERLDDGEVSPYLVDDAQVGDVVEIRGPVGGWFVWEDEPGGPLWLDRRRLRCRAAAARCCVIVQLAGSDTLARLLLSAKAPARRDLPRRASNREDVERTPTRARRPPAGRATPAASIARCSPSRALRPRSARGSSSAGRRASSRASRMILDAARA